MAGLLDQKQFNFTPIRADGANPFTADQDLGGHGFTNARPPVAGTDLVTKNYADALIAGLSWKVPCLVATTANIALTGLQVIDGVSVLDGQRVLVRAQTLPAQNGIYIAHSGAWVRSPDANSPSELDGAATFILAGTTNANTSWVQTTQDPVIGTDPILFVMFGSLNGSVASHEIDGFIKTDSDFSSMNPIPGTTKVFTTGRAGRTFFSFFGQASGLSSLPSDSLAINVDGTVYTLPIFALEIGAGQDKAFDLALSGSISIPLAAGTHTAFLVGSVSGLGYIATPANPMTLTIIYPNLVGPVATASPITGQTVSANGGGVFDTNSTSFVPVPGTQLPNPIVLSAPQVVVFTAFGTAASLGDGSCSTQIGFRVNGVDYPGTAVNEYFGSGVEPGLFVSAPVLLPAGSYTPEIVIRQLPGTPPLRHGRIYTTPDFPATLTAVYTVPQAVTPAVFSLMVSAERVSGDIADPPDSAGAWVDLPGPGVNPTFDLVFTPSITGKARVTISGSIRAIQFFFGIGLQVNGVDLLPAGLDSGFPNGYVSVGGGRGGVSPSDVQGSISFSTLIDVVAGVLTTVRLRYICLVTAGSGQTGTIFATTGHPLRAHVEFN